MQLWQLGNILILLMLLISEPTFQECRKDFGVCCKRVQGCRGHPSAGVQWRQTAAPQLAGTGEGWWRTRIVGGHHGSAPPCSSPSPGTPAEARAGGDVPICAGAQTSAVPPGASPPDNEPSWHREVAAVLLHCFAGMGLWTRKVTTVGSFWVFLEQILGIERFCSWVLNGGGMWARSGEKVIFGVQEASLHGALSTWVLQRAVLALKISVLKMLM